MNDERNGQISVEFLLVITFFLAIMAAIVLPMTRTSINAAKDASILGETRGFAELMKTNVDIVGAEGPNSRKTFRISVPSKLYQIKMDSGYRLVIVGSTTKGQEEVGVNTSFLTIFNPTFQTDIYNNRGENVDVQAETFYNDSHKTYVRLRVF